MILYFMILNAVAVIVATGNTEKIVEQRDQKVLNFPPLDLHDFKELLLQCDVFVDKSLLIEEFLNVTEKGPVVINQPIGWGKSLNLDMLRRFVEIEVNEEGVELPDDRKINKKLFLGGEVNDGNRKKKLKKLKIAQHSHIVEKYLGKFPVIFFSLKNIFQPDYRNMKTRLAEKLMNLYTERYSYLKKYCAHDDTTIANLNKPEVREYFDGKISADSNLNNALYTLSHLLKAHFGQKVFVLIDDYEEAVHNAYQKFENQTELFTKYVNVIGGMLGMALKGNSNLERGCLTGVFPFHEFGSGLDNLNHYFIPQKEFSKFYGFTENEVKQLLNVVATSTKLEDMKPWYNGFYIGGQSIYYPISVLQCLKNKGKLQRYIVLTDRFDYLEGHTVWSDHFQCGVQRFLINCTRFFFYSIYPPAEEDYLGNGRMFNDSMRDIHFFLLFGGYMAVEERNITGHFYLHIPNHEAYFAYEKVQLRWTTYDFGFAPGWQIAPANFLGNYKIKEFETALQKVMKTTDLLKRIYADEYGDDRLLHNGIMLGIAYAFPAHFFLVGGMETDPLGKVELLFVPSITSQTKDAIILQFAVVERGNYTLAEIAESSAKKIEIFKYSKKLQRFPYLEYVYKVFVVFELYDIAAAYHKVLSYNLNQLIGTSIAKNPYWLAID